jgi:hypothetical protein
MTNTEERMQILQMIEDGKISAADGLRLLDSLGAAAEAAGEAWAEGARAETGGGAAPAADPGLDRWRAWWKLPAYVGLGIVFVGSLLMYWAISASGVGFWLLCASLPFGLGVLLLALAAGARSAKWVHVRVNTGQDEWPRRIAISLPLPIRFTAWLLRIFGPFIPALKDRGIDELIMALGESATPETPLYIDVHEKEGGEHVQVYIG